jgi:hypothetical protein
MAKTTCTICDKDAIARGWCKAHYRRWQQYGDPTGKPDTPSRDTLFWAKVNKTPTCWLWTGSIIRNGYGNFYVGDATRLAHRFAYELLVGKIPEGLTIDHLCRVRNCVNPDHLEPVTGAENTRRGEAGKHFADRTHCPKGHAYDEENTRYSKRGTRVCKACQDAMTRAYRERNPEKLRAQYDARNARRNEDRKGKPAAVPKTHCPNGHPYDEANTAIRWDGRRQCRACRKLSQDRYNAKRPQRADK